MAKTKANWGRDSFLEQTLERWGVPIVMDTVRITSIDLERGRNNNARLEELDEENVQRQGRHRLNGHQSKNGKHDRADSGRSSRSAARAACAVS